MGTVPPARPPTTPSIPPYLTLSLRSDVARWLQHWHTMVIIICLRNYTQLGFFKMDFSPWTLLLFQLGRLELTNTMKVVLIVTDYQSWKKFIILSKVSDRKCKTVYDTSYEGHVETQCKPGYASKCKTVYKTGYKKYPLFKFPLFFFHPQVLYYGARRRV